MSEQLESWKLVRAEERSGEEVDEAAQVEATLAERAHYFITTVTTQTATQLEEKNVISFPSDCVHVPASLQKSAWAGEVHASRHFAPISSCRAGLASLMAMMLII